MELLQQEGRKAALAALAAHSPVTGAALRKETTK